MGGSNDTSDLALLIAGVSLGVSLMTFAWRVVYDIYFDAARLSVKLDAVVVSGSPLQEMYSISATNRGRRPTTITSLWLCFGRPRRWWWRHARFVLPKSAREKLFKAATMLPDAAGAVLSGTIPKRLDPSDQVQVFYSQAAVRQTARAHGERMFYGDARSSTGRKSSKAVHLSL